MSVINYYENIYCSEEIQGDWEDYGEDEKIVEEIDGKERKEEVVKEKVSEEELKALKKFNWAGKKMEVKDFPSLGSCIEKESEKESEKKVKFGKIKKSTSNTSVVSWSVIDQKKMDEEVDYSERTDAFDILGSKEAITKKLKKTKMCRTVKEGKECPYGEKCCFAHNKDELSIIYCFFIGQRCRFVYFRNEKCYNKQGGRKCYHLHYCETKSQYYERINELPKKVEFTPVERKVESKVEVEYTFPPPKTTISSIPASKLRRYKKEGAKCVLRVPEAFFYDAVELAKKMYEKMGEENVSVELV